MCAVKLMQRRSWTGATETEVGRQLTRMAEVGNSCTSPTLQPNIFAMLEYDLYLPLHHNDGRPIDGDKLKNLKRRLVDEFGGLTHFRQENEGLWKIGDHTFRDRIEIVRVLANDEISAQTYFAQLKADLRRDWDQQDFLIVSRQVSAV
jgi:hypothetical protein